MAKFTTYITEKGWDTLLKEGFMDTLNYFTVQDSTIIYSIDDGIDSPAFYDLPIVGSRKGTTMIPNCSFAQRKSIPIEELTENEIINSDRRVRISFVNEDCDVPFEKSNITVTVNIEKWIDYLLGLKNSEYSRTASGLRLDFWDYTRGSLQEYSLTTSSYEDKEIYDIVDITHTFKSDKDFETYKYLSPKYMSVNADGRKVFNNNQSKVRFGSNMIFGFKTNAVDGTSVYNTAPYLGLYPDKWGYLIDGTFYNLGDGEDLISANGIETYKTVYPIVVIDGVNYLLKDDKDLRTQDGIGYMVWGYESVDGVKAIDALTDKLKLFMKSNGTEIENGVYQVEINMGTILTGNNEFNQAFTNNSKGGEIVFKFIYKTNSVSSDIYEIK